MRWVLVSAALALASIGCKGEAVETATIDAGGSETTSEDSPAPGDTSSPPNDAADAGSTAGVELLENPGFELGCAGYDAFISTLTDSTTARTGSGSCRVCGRGGEYSFGIRQHDSKGLVAGAKYLAEAWLRADPAGAPMAPDPKANVIFYDASGAEVGGAEGTVIALDGTWKRSSALLTLPAGVTEIAIDVGSHIVTDAGEVCFLIDDASLHRVP